MLFSKKKKEEVKDVSTQTDQGSQAVNGVVVKVLGSGCAKCNKLEQAAIQALEELKIDATIEHVTDFAQIATYGVMSTPALVINEAVVSSGNVLSVKQIVNILQDIVQ